MKPTQPGPGMEGALHDVTNAVAAGRSYLDIVILRVRKLPPELQAQLIPEIESSVKEYERIGDIVRTVRGGLIDTYQPGDVLACNDCGYTFVHRKAVGKIGSCRRCKSYQVARWKP